MPLVLSCPEARASAPLSIDLDGITPDRVAGLSPAHAARLAVTADGRPCDVGALFGVAGIELVGDCSRVHRIGGRMAWGTIVVGGDAGRHAGEAMTGGSLTIAGNAGDWLAAEMSGGFVRVAGSVGDNAAAALPGSESGLRGGVVVVGGDAGCLAGARMRRGLLAIGGRCGEAAALELRAGTVVVGGADGGRAGMGMRRGTVVFLTCVPEVPPTFTRGVAWCPTFLPLLARRLERAGFRPAAGPPTEGLFAGTWQQWHGDLLAGGRGEILHRQVAG
ncbi:MAG: formylmethanofuran dehydrogenase subunit C [Planctomycetia bacterium]|nr:formylmethanofuran dehydrogenase subunit C [Planctomycetia bacterium]